MITRRERRDRLLDVCPTFEPQWRSFEKDFGRDYDEWSLLPVMHHFARHLYDLVEDGRPESLAASLALVWRLQTEGDEEVRQAVDIGFVPALDRFDRPAKDCFDRLREVVPPPLRDWWDGLPREAVAGLHSLRTYYRSDPDRCSRCGDEIAPPTEETRIVSHEAGYAKVVLCPGCERHYRQFYKIGCTTVIGLVIVLIALALGLELFSHS